jgi:hypothetical protein
MHLVTRVRDLPVLRPVTPLRVIMTLAVMVPMEVLNRVAAGMSAAIRRHVGDGRSLLRPGS